MKEKEWRTEAELVVNFVVWTWKIFFKEMEEAERSSRRRSVLQWTLKLNSDGRFCSYMFSSNSNFHKSLHRGLCFLASELAYRKIAWFLSKFQTWLGQKKLVFAHIVDFLECLLFSNYTETVLLDRHQVWRSHDPMSSDFWLLWKKDSYPLF